MGLLFGEGRVLKKKYMKQLGLTQSEAIDKVGKLIDEIDLIKYKMQKKKKSDLEIELKVQRRFEEEFQKLCEYD